MRRTSPITKSCHAAPHQAGFTLIELMLAVTIGALVLSAVYSTFGVALDAKRRIARVATDTQAWRFFVERLRADLKNLIVEERTIQGDRKTLTLQVLPPQQEPAEVRYERHTSADGGQIRRHVLRGDEETDTVVFDGVEALSFRYLIDGDWQDESDEGLPHAVECTVEGNGHVRAFVVALEVEYAANE